jgi:ferredoxin-NADP reductase
MDTVTPKTPASVASLSDIRVAKLVDRAPFACSRWLRFELTDDRPLVFSGGQYVIVETGLTLANGKPRRRAYSLLSDDGVHTHFELAVFQLPGGAGSQLMGQLELGGELRFSAPWGKLRAPTDDACGPVWVIATDSGISAALGLIQARDFARRLARASIHVWTTSPHAFLDPTFIRARATTRAQLEFGTLSAIGSEQRQCEARERTRQLLADASPDHVYLLGDGEVARDLSALLIEHGVDPARIQVESFFNHIERKPAPARSTPVRVVLGVGCDRGTPAELFERGVLQTLSAHGLSLGNLHSLASIDRKHDEPALLAFADKYRLPLRFFSAETLDAVSGIEHASERVRASVGTRAVSEPAALLASGAAALLVAKTRYTEPGAGRSMTLALAALPSTANVSQTTTPPSAASRSTAPTKNPSTPGAAES